MRRVGLLFILTSIALVSLIVTMCIVAATTAADPSADPSATRAAHSVGIGVSIAMCTIVAILALTTFQYNRIAEDAETTAAENIEFDRTRRELEKDASDFQQFITKKRKKERHVEHFKSPEMMQKATAGLLRLQQQNDHPHVDSFVPDRNFDNKAAVVASAMATHNARLQERDNKAAVNARLQRRETGRDAFNRESDDDDDSIDFESIIDWDANVKDNTTDPCLVKLHTRSRDVWGEMDVPSQGHVERDQSGDGGGDTVNSSDDEHDPDQYLSVASMDQHPHA
jgi:hypothetical protein